MRKSLVLFVAVVFVFAFSVGILANDPVGTQYWADYMEDYALHVDDDGIVRDGDVDINNPGNYTILNGYDQEENFLGLNRSALHNDNDPNKTPDENDQKVSVNIQAVAFIPCYLEMTVTGNQGQTVAQSFGPGAEANASASTFVPTSVGWAYYRMTFDNEEGGFVNDSWESLGHGINAEIEAGENVYIQSCDIFRVEVYANEDYKYEVELTQPLTGSNNSNSGLILPLDMRTKVDEGAWYTTTNLTGTQLIAQRGPAVSLTAYHNFRVPMAENTIHGQYAGEITFKAATL